MPAADGGSDEDQWNDAYAQPETACLILLGGGDRCVTGGERTVCPLKVLRGFQSARASGGGVGNRLGRDRPTDR